MLSCLLHAGHLVTQTEQCFYALKRSFPIFVSINISIKNYPSMTKLILFSTPQDHQRQALSTTLSVQRFASQSLKRKLCFGAQQNTFYSLYFRLRK